MLDASMPVPAARKNRTCASGGAALAKRPYSETRTAMAGKRAKPKEDNACSHRHQPVPPDLLVSTPQNIFPAAKEYLPPCCRTRS
jgi:hypothetical protein